MISLQTKSRSSALEQHFLPVARAALYDLFGGKAGCQGNVVRPSLLVRGLEGPECGMNNLPVPLQ